jgi:hypothetical protein
MAKEIPAFLRAEIGNNATCPWRIGKSSQLRIGPSGLVSQFGDPSMIQSAPNPQ